MPQIQMNKNQALVAWAIFSSLLTGCATMDKSASFSMVQQAAVKKIIDGEGDVWSYSTKEFDLDGDGKKEAIVIYARGTHHSGVKVIRFDGDKADIIFDESCSTPNTDFKVVRGTPTIILEDSEYSPDYGIGKRYKQAYKWDGKNFIKVSLAGYN